MAKLPAIVDVLGIGPCLVTADRISRGITRGNWILVKEEENGSLDTV